MYWKPGHRLNAQPIKTLFYLVWHSAACDLSTIAADFPHFIFSPVVRDLVVTLDQKLTLLRIFTASVVIHTTSCTSSALWFAHLPQIPLLHLSLPHYSPTRLLQLTLCWPSSWAVTVPRPGPVHCHTSLWAHHQIWPCFQLLLVLTAAHLMETLKFQFKITSFLNVELPLTFEFMHSGFFFSLG